MLTILIVMLFLTVATFDLCLYKLLVHPVIEGTILLTILHAFVVLNVRLIDQKFASVERIQC